LSVLSLDAVGSPSGKVREAKVSSGDSKALNLRESAVVLGSTTRDTADTDLAVIRAAGDAAFVGLDLSTLTAHNLAIMAAVDSRSSLLPQRDTASPSSATKVDGEMGDYWGEDAGQPLPLMPQHFC
jgi:hypothetical protein